MAVTVVTTATAVMVAATEEKTVIVSAAVLATEAVAVNAVTVVLLAVRPGPDLALLTVVPVPAPDLPETEVIAAVDATKETTTGTEVAPVADAETAATVAVASLATRLRAAVARMVTLTTTTAGVTTENPLVTTAATTTAAWAVTRLSGTPNRPPPIRKEATLSRLRPLLPPRLSLRPMSLLRSRWRCSKNELVVDPTQVLLLKSCNQLKEKEPTPT